MSDLFLGLIFRYLHVVKRWRLLDKEALTCFSDRVIKYLDYHALLRLAVSDDVKRQKCIDDTVEPFVARVFRMHRTSS